MADTGDAAKAAVVAAIQAIATSELGFDVANGNVKDYLRDEEATELQGVYPLATVGSKERVRAWGVQVYTNEDLEIGFSQQITREYEIVIQAYYGVHGSSPWNTMNSHAHEVREAIAGLGGRLSNTVQIVQDVTPFKLVEKINEADGSIEIFVGEMVYSARKEAATW